MGIGIAVKNFAMVVLIVAQVKMTNGGQGLPGSCGPVVSGPKVGPLNRSLLCLIY